MQLLLARTLAALLLLVANGALLARADNAKYSLQLTGIDSGTAYTLNVKIGSATTGAITTFRVIADTGSSNDAILGANCCGKSANRTFACSASSTCAASTTSVSISFAGAAISGHLVTDKWASTEFGAVTKQFLVIEAQEGFYRPEYDGISGLAYSTLAQPTAAHPPSFYNDLVAAGATKDAFGMQLCGIMQPLLTKPTNVSLHAGQLLIGGINGPSGESYFTGPMLYSPIAREAWYVVAISDIGFNGKSLGLACSKYNEPQAIIDSGTSNMAFPSEIYNALMAQIKAATLDALPTFDANYFDARKSCCGVAYCDPRVASAVLLSLPSIYITLALDSSEGATNEHFTVEIPPAYYWRPEMNGVDNNLPCRAIGISEGSSIMLGDVFMDGLYAYHDRENKKLGLAVTTNCPNGVTSTKKVYVATNRTDDWCACFSTSLQSKSLLARHVPWGNGCFFWVWWLYVVIGSVAVVLLAIAVGVYWCVTDRKMKKMKTHARLHHGSDALTRAGSGSRSASSSAALVPAPTPASYRTQQPPHVQHVEHDATHYIAMGSPHSSSASSRASSIALLSSPSTSQQSRQSQQRDSAASTFRKRGVSRDVV